MQTAESARLLGLFGGLGKRAESGSALSASLLGKMQNARRRAFPIIPKNISVQDRELVALSLQNGEESEITGIGKGIHRPYRVTFRGGHQAGIVSSKQAVVKTVCCQFENKRYCQSVDIKILGPEREVLSYELDKVLGFDLVPPTVGRDISTLGFASVQAWVFAPSAWEWKAEGYDYRDDHGNPWVHRLAAFDFIRGELDRHGNNFLMDEKHRIYAIDNGYSFVKGDDRRWFRTGAGKSLVGHSIHPEILEEIRGIDENRVHEILQHRGFSHGEDVGVLSRIRELKKLETWQKLGDLW